MNHRILAVALVAAGLPVSTGCAADEVEGREAAYPEPIGYTLPPPAPPPPAPSAAAPPAADEEEVGAPPAQQDDYDDTDPSAVTAFRPALDPYGAWVEDPTYGTAWVPAPDAVGADFTPYATAGHWAYDDDYVWVSDYAWGWAPFHYGRWVYASGPGWEWIPGRRYAGAWVSWRYGVGDWGFVGWAPLGPTWCWRHGAAIGLGFVPSAPYAFVGTRDLFAPAIGARLVAGPQVRAIAANTRPWVPASPRVGAGGRALLGPPPTALNINASAVVHTGAGDRGLAQARAFAAPNASLTLGGRGPQAVPRAAASMTAWSSRPGAVGAAPVAASPSHFGGRLGGGFRGSAASAPPPVYSSNAPAYSSSAGRPYFGTPRPAYQTPSAGYSPAARAPMAASGSWGGGFHGGGGAHFGGGGAGVHAGGSYGGSHGGGGSRGGGGRGGGHR